MLFMKRSDMIEKIELALSQIAYAESIDRKKFESDYIAHRILEVCEEAGMLPPFVKNPGIPEDMSRIQWASRKAVERAYNYEHLPEDFEINIWEEENEEE